MTDADEGRQRQQQGQRQPRQDIIHDTGSSNLWMPSGSRITISTAAATQAHTYIASNSTLHSQCASPVVELYSRDTEHYDGRRVEGTRRQDEVWKWTGRRGGQPASRHPRAEHRGHQSHITEAHSRPNPTKCSHSTWTEVSDCGPKKGRNTRMKIS